MRTRTRGKILLRNCAKTRYVQHTAYALTHRKWRSKVSRPLMSEGLGELKWACSLCSTKMPAFAGTVPVKAGIFC